VVAIFSHALWRGEKPKMFGFGKPTRDYVHVADVTEATMRASGTRGTFNVATGTETPVSKLLEILAEAAGTSVEPVELPLREGELERSCLDASLASTVLDWRPKVRLEDGLRQTYNELVVEFDAAEQPA
jgi:nucleoside-diphosphate-sugar epimerase